MYIEYLYVRYNYMFILFNPHDERDIILTL